mmetsp:Transcript_9082/g.19815  ORF Transcript_9082/g.19815 Transcript_9082/m.19815 type:complete len:231 (-) Transcript_9082:236-928(-)
MRCMHALPHVHLVLACLIVLCLRTCTHRVCTHHGQVLHAQHMRCLHSACGRWLRKRCFSEHCANASATFTWAAQPCMGNTVMRALAFHDTQAKRRRACTCTTCVCTPAFHSCGLFASTPLTCACISCGHTRHMSMHTSHVHALLARRRRRCTHSSTKRGCKPAHGACARSHVPCLSRRPATKNECPCACICEILASTRASRAIRSTTFRCVGALTMWGNVLQSFTSFHYP